LKRYLVPAIVIAALGVAVGSLVLAFTQDSKQTSTGEFSVATENISISLTTLNAATGAADPGWPSCSAANMTNGQTTYCLFRVTNNTTSGAVRYSWRTVSTDNSDGKNLEAAITVTAHLAPNATSCNAALNNPISTPTPLQLFPGFGNELPGQQAGDRELLALASEHVCLKMVYTQPTPVPFGAKTSAVFGVDADDAP
jgi:hypothetical protein